MNQALVFVLGLATATALPMQTMSSVCPAIDFTQQTTEINGMMVFEFYPHFNGHFEFVDLHLSNGINLPMHREGDGPYRASIASPSSSAGLQYSFTYCVEMHGKPVDCNSEHFTIIQITYDWMSGIVSCPTECGLPAQHVEVPVQCVGSDGLQYPDEMCMAHLRPPPLTCPATPACVTFNWRESLVSCPTHCGLPAQTIETPASCVGSDGMEYPDEMCPPQLRPAAVTCPATPACLSFFWQAQTVACPTECGMPTTQIQPQAVCMGSDGGVYPGSCSHLPMPAAVTCPATPACVTFNWRGGLVSCPTQCGQPAQTIETPASCVGSDGMEYPDEMCSGQPRPAPVNCPATEPCVSFHWAAQPVACPTECGMPQTSMPVPSVCMGSDGQEWPGMCAHLPRPADMTCPATALCRWRQGLAECPTACGMPAQMVQPRVSCVDDMGSPTIETKCDKALRPAGQFCPATAACMAPIVEPQCTSDKPCFVSAGVLQVAHAQPVAQKMKIGKMGKVGKLGKHGPPGPPSASFRVGKLGKHAAGGLVGGYQQPLAYQLGYSYQQPIYGAYGAGFGTAQYGYGY